MSLFVLGSIVLVAMALAFVVAPLWRVARGVAVAAAVATVLVGGGFYAMVGSPTALQPPGAVQAPASLDEEIDALATHLQANPDELEGWMLLGRSRKSQERFDDALAAFEQAWRLAPDDADVLVEYAEAQVLASPSRRVEGEPLAMIEAALERNPTQQRALLLLGIHHQQEGRPAEAAQTWERLLALLQPEAATGLLARINDARAEAGLSPLSDEPAPLVHEGTRVTVRIEMNPLLRDRPIGGATLFVIARQVDGPNMPVAVHRQPITGFPVEVTLSDANAMLPSLKLSDLGAVRLDARISLSGDAAPVAGDLEAESLVIGVRDGREETMVIERIVSDAR